VAGCPWVADEPEVLDDLRERGAGSIAHALPVTLSAIDRREHDLIGHRLEWPKPAVVLGLRLLPALLCHRAAPSLGGRPRGAVAITDALACREKGGALRDNRRCIEAVSRCRAPGRCCAAGAAYVLTSATIALPVPQIAANPEQSEVIPAISGLVPQINADDPRFAAIPFCENPAASRDL
jgi:hypothetical protein